MQTGVTTFIASLLHVADGATGSSLYAQNFLAYLSRPSLPQVCHVTYVAGRSNETMTSASRDGVFITIGGLKVEPWLRKFAAWYARRPYPWFSSCGDVTSSVPHRIASFSEGLNVEGDSTSGVGFMSPRARLA